MKAQGPNLRRLLWIGVVTFMAMLLIEPKVRSAEQVTGFEEVSKEAGIEARIICGTPEKKSILDVNGTGACWFDYDNDGHVDLYIVNGSTVEDLKSGKGRRQQNYLYRNSGDGTFTDLTEAAGVAGDGWGQGCAAADYDNDGYTDLLVTNFGPNELFHNNGDGTFTETGDATGVAGGDTWHTGVAFADYDNDGFVDIYIAGYVEFDVDEPANYAKLCYHRTMPTFCGPRGFVAAPDFLYHNNGDGTFSDVTREAGVEDTELYYGLGVAFEDFDGDGHPDIFIANDASFNYLYRNLGNGKFKEEALRAGIACCEDGVEQADMGIAVGDYNNDGRPDVFITTYSEDHYSLFQNQGKFFVDVTRETGLYKVTLPYLGWGALLFDYDHDGFRDLFTANGHIFPGADEHFTDTPYRQQLLLLKNSGGEKFEDVSREVGLAALEPTAGRGAAASDYDNDGDIDVLVVNMDATPSLLRNRLGGSRNWLQVRTIGTRSNRSGIGARVEVVAGGLKLTDSVRSGGSFLSHNDMRLHFGLGPQKRVDLVTVSWPSGVVDRVRNVAVNQQIVIEEGKGQVRPAMTGVSEYETAIDPRIAKPDP